MATCKCSKTPCVCEKNVNEHINKIKNISNYINEARYSLVGNEFNSDDSVPEEIWTDPKAVQPASQNQSGIFEDDEEDMLPDMPDLEAPQGAEGGDDSLPPVDGDMPAVDSPEGEEGAPDAEAIAAPEPTPEPEEPSVDELQNDLIKLNISTMQNMNDKVAALENTIEMMNHRFRDLNNDVEEVREPTNVEKLTSRKEDSHPFYYGLNDMWQGNTFQARRDESGERGMKQMEDGTFIADFDQMNKFTDYEVKDSFDI